MGNATSTYDSDRIQGAQKDLSESVDRLFTTGISSTNDIQSSRKWGYHNGPVAFRSRYAETLSDCADEVKAINTEATSLYNSMGKIKIDAIDADLTSAQIADHLTAAQKSAQAPTTKTM